MSGLFKGKTPKVEPVSKMPDAEDPALIEARRRKQADMQRRGGRDSTIMSDALVGASGKLGA